MAARRALIVISLGVLLATSTWFTGTAAARELAASWSLDDQQRAWLTSATQWGFIVGTLVYALANLADRYDARRVFCVSALAGAAANLGFAWASAGLGAALGFRFATGVALAGVYPVGMKLIASWFMAPSERSERADAKRTKRAQSTGGCGGIGTPPGGPHGPSSTTNQPPSERSERADAKRTKRAQSTGGCGGMEAGLGWRLGLMVGCLTLGTAFPYGVAALGLDLDWRSLASVASLAASVGGLLVLLGCERGPYLRERARLDLRMIGAVFRHPPFRATALGYFGHMWELYALWSLSGHWLDARFERSLEWTAKVPLIAFATVAIGALGCVGGGLISRRIGERKVALIALIGSGICCLLSGFAFALPGPALVGFLLIWGLLVVADSPQFSALAARHAPAGYTGTALTVQNGIGFLITIATIQLVPLVAGQVGWRWVFTLLAIGPLCGALAIARVSDRRERPA